MDTSAPDQATASAVSNPANITREDLAATAEQRLDDWHRKARFWYGMYYILGISAAVLTVSVAAYPRQWLIKDDWPLHAIAWAAVVFQTSSTFLAALPKAAAYRAAWRMVWFARAQYQHSADQSSQETKNLLMNAIANGWRVIDGGYEHPHGSQSPELAESTKWRKSTGARPTTAPTTKTED
jgi:hypothetical protein